MLTRDQTTRFPLDTFHRHAHLKSRPRRLWMIRNRPARPRRAPLTLTHVSGSDVDVETSTDVVAERLKEVEKGGDNYLVDWEGLNDPDNPRNWSKFKKGFVASCISLLTFSVHIGSAIYASFFPGMMSRFGVSQTEAALGLTLYALAYGVGPMFLTPLQELPSTGRNPVYIIGLAIFLLFNVPIVKAESYGTVLAFLLTGFVGSPALATGGGSMADVYDGSTLPYLIGMWCLGATAGSIRKFQAFKMTGNHSDHDFALPSRSCYCESHDLSLYLSPLANISLKGGFSAQAKDWRWPIHGLMRISAFALVFLSLFLPETMGDNILLKRARRLRQLTGNSHLRSRNGIDQANMSKREIAYEALVRPLVLSAEPAVLFLNIYLGLVYSIFYLWFEAFPFVFNEIYQMNLGVSSLPFLAFVVSSGLAYIAYCFYLKYHLEPRSEKNPDLPPDRKPV
ncbi:hypothetical protein V5O48_004760 [Marasmius crinis-equi]|uniref:Uncharacterized protein n=1 Tax=Marasmius crinis-equi TaxID=585013 RepID=A0ABR3FP42_9AGAR